MKGWAEPGEFKPHEEPAIPEFVGTDIRQTEQGAIVVERAQDVEPILERCKELARSDTFRSESNELHHVAEFPLVLIEKYCADKGVTFQEFMHNMDHVKAMLGDPALRDFQIAANATHKVYR